MGCMGRFGARQRRQCGRGYSKSTSNTSKYILYRSTTVLNMTVKKVERAVRTRGWEKRRRRRTWSLRKIDFDLDSLKLRTMKITNPS